MRFSIITKQNIVWALFTIAGCFFKPELRAQTKTIRLSQSAIDWPKFMHRQDMVWNDTLPNDWTNGPFIGNGMLGTVIYTVKNGNAIRLDIGRCDYEDHRDSTQKGSATRYPRLPIGYFLLKPVGRILKTSNMRLDLYNAETTADITTTKGSIHFKAYVHSKQMLIILECSTNGEEKDFTFEFNPMQAISPRQQYGIDHKDTARIAKRYPLNPAYTLGKIGKVDYCEQKLLSGGSLTTAWKQTTAGLDRTIMINATHTYPTSQSTTLAVGEVNKFGTADLARLYRDHCRWWNNYYPISFVSVPDARIENFYWIQMYKLASATRAGMPIIDDQGPWLEPTAWPYATWNLNVQLSYWPVYTSNRLDLGKSLLNGLWNNRATLRTNLPAEYQKDSYGIGRATGTNLLAAVGIPGVSKIPEIGNLTWACHDLYMQYRHSMDQAMLSDTIYPLLRGSINYYFNFLKTDDAGKLHLLTTLSPEYPKLAEDMNYDLSLLQWGCKILIETNDKFKKNDPLRPKWENVLNNLTPFPADSNGLMIGKNQPLQISHRHFSHMLMIYPLYDINIEQAGGRELMQKSLNFWLSKKGALKGYSYTGSSSIAAALGNGDASLKNLDGLWNGGFLQPNTFYKESGPVIETPLSGAQSVHDMLLQSWGDKIRVFPAVSSAWANVSYQGLSAEGGFLLSAFRQNGKTQFVTIKSNAGEPCIINPAIDGEVLVSDPRFKLTKLANGFYSIDLKKGDVVTLYAKGVNNFAVAPVAILNGSENYYGSNAMKNAVKVNEEKLMTPP